MEGTSGCFSGKNGRRGGGKKGIEEMEGSLVSYLTEVRYRAGGGPCRRGRGHRYNG